MVSLLCSRHGADGRACGEPLLEVDRRAVTAPDLPRGLVVVGCRRCRTEWWLTARDLVEAVASTLGTGAPVAWLRTGRDESVRGEPVREPTGSIVS